MKIIVFQDVIWCSHNFVTKEPQMTATTQGEFIAEQLSQLPSLQQYLGSHTFKDNCKVETTVIQKLAAQDTDFN